MNPHNLMLACPLEPERIRFPVYGSPKFDGIRAANQFNGLLTRSLTPVPNKFVRERFECGSLMGVDGELIAGSATDPNAMQNTQSVVMSDFRADPVTFFVFDMLGINKMPYCERHQVLREIVKQAGVPNVVLAEQRPITNMEELERFEEEQVELGYEGAIFRCVNGIYKPTRASMVGQELMKLKRWEDAEAVIVGYEPLFRNLNPATIDARGLTKRGKSKENLVETELLGKFIVRDLLTDEVFKLSGRIKAKERAHLWSIRQQLLGLFVTYKHFNVTGVRIKPRQPIFKSFRSPLDFQMP